MVSPKDQPVDPSKQEKNLGKQREEGVFDSDCLFGELQEITICHNGECYRLRKTKTGKLILNK